MKLSEFKVGMKVAPEGHGGYYAFEDYESYRVETVAYDYVIIRMEGGNNPHMITEDLANCFVHGKWIHKEDGYHVLVKYE